VKLIIACIPAYNEEKTIARVILDCLKYCDKVIVCDDGSTDYTGIIAEKLGAEVIRHDKNLGYGAALKSLFKAAMKYSPDIVITLDADLQHDPSYIPKLIEPIKEGLADIVIGARSSSDETPKYRRFGVKLFSKLSGFNVSDVQSGFRAYKGDIIQKILPESDGMEASIEILDKALNLNLRITEVRITIRYEGLDTSTLNPVVHGYSILTEIIHRRILKKPITYVGIPGFLMLTIGLILGVWIVFRYIEVHQLAIGTAFIMVILVIGGLIMILLSILLYIITSIVNVQSIKR